MSIKYNVILNVKDMQRLQLSLLIPICVGVILMKFSIEIFAQAISQWRDCYIDYGFLKVFIMLIKTIVEECEELQQFLSIQRLTEDSDQGVGNTATEKYTKELVSQLNKNIELLKNIATDLNAIFIKAFQKETEICQQFCLIKYQGVKSRFQMAVAFAAISDHQEKQNILIPYLEYVYIQADYLKKMSESNIEGQRKILKKHKKYAKKMIETPQNYLNQNLDSKAFETFTNEIEDYYVALDHKLTKGKKKPKTSRNYIRELAKKPEATSKDSFIFGLWVGIIVAVIALMSFLLAYQGKSVETDPVFNRDFPTWRGIAFIIIYIWVLGVDVYYFQKFMISHRIILDLIQHHYSTSTKIFKISGLFSTVFVILFTLYALNLADFITLGKLPPQYLSLMAWAIFILFMFNPFPVFYHQSRLFTIILFFKIVISPFVGVSFPVAWATDQLVSLLTPLGDVAYTICFYFGQNFNDQLVKTNNCKGPSNIAQFIFSVVVLSYRMVQCMRQGYDKRKYWRQFQMYNTIKYALSILTTIFSYLYRNGTTNIFVAWITFAAASTIYSYAWDLKVDWALLERKSQHFMLRDKITYAPRFYYILMVLNFFLRLAWVLTLSQNITDKLFGSAELFKLVTGALEIIRRAAWNLVRIEKEHIKNCDEFKAIPSRRDQFEVKIKAKIEESKARMDSMERVENVNLDQIAQDLDLLKKSQLTEYNEKNYHLVPLDEIKQKIAQHCQSKKEWRKIYKQKRKQVEEIRKECKKLLPWMQGPSQ